MPCGVTGTKAAPSVWSFLDRPSLTHIDGRMSKSLWAAPESWCRQAAVLAMDAQSTGGQSSESEPGLWLAPWAIDTIGGFDPPVATRSLVDYRASQACAVSLSSFSESEFAADRREETSHALTIDLSVVIPTFDEESNVGPVVTEVRQVCEQLGLRHEILVVDGGSRDQTAARARDAGARVIVQRRPGYGAALAEAFAEARGRFVVTLDSDLSHPPQILRTLYGSRHRAEILIASRYVKGGQANMPWSRLLLSRVLNRVFARYLALPIADLSSGFRLYHTDVLRVIRTEHTDFSFLQELLVKAYSAGYRVEEIPFHYFPRKHGYSKARVIRFGISYLKLLRKSRGLRRDPGSADREEQAYSSGWPLTRWRERLAYRAFTTLARSVLHTLVVGCGSHVFEAFPGALGLDPRLAKARYRRTLGNPLVCSEIVGLPFADATFEQVICTTPVPAMASADRPLRELARILRPGAPLVVAVSVARGSLPDGVSSAESQVRALMAAASLTVDQLLRVHSGLWIARATTATEPVGS